MNFPVEHYGAVALLIIHLKRQSISGKPVLNATDHQLFLLGCCTFTELEIDLRDAGQSVGIQSEWLLLYC